MSGQASTGAAFTGALASPIRRALLFYLGHCVAATQSPKAASLEESDFLFKMKTILYPQNFESVSPREPSKKFFRKFPNPVNRFTKAI